MTSKSVNFHCEIIDGTNFLVTSLLDAKDVCGYESPEGASPNILLPDKERKTNGAIQFCYEMKSKVSLTQATERAKISKNDFLKLIEGSVSAFSWLSENRLMSSSVVFDLNHVYVTIKNYEPSFVWLPIRNSNASNDDQEQYKALSAFFLKLITLGKTKFDDDNFMKTMTSKLNSQILSLGELKKLVEKEKKSGHFNSTLLLVVDLAIWAVVIALVRLDMLNDSIGRTVGIVSGALPLLWMAKNAFYKKFNINSENSSVNEAESKPTSGLNDARLEYYDRGGLKKILLDRPSVIVGRLPKYVDHPIFLSQISHMHAKFSNDSGKYSVTDYNSKYGTYINGARIPGNTPRRITNGDKIMLANVELTFSCGETLILLSV